jgi:hypothetical protein
MALYYAKSTGGFYSTEIHGNNIPADAVTITKEQHIALLSAQTIGKVITADEDGKPVLADPAPPTLEDMTKQAVMVIQDHLDAEAQKIDPATLVRFDSIHTAGIWINSTNQARAKRAQDLLAWADRVWNFATEEMLKQMAGTPTYKTVAELIAALPKIGA